MAMPTMYSREDILDVAAQLVAEDRSTPAVSEIARRLGAPSGSIYHRFASRDELLTVLWLRGVRRFHQHYLADQAPADTPGAAAQALEDMAVRVVTHVRDDPVNAAVMDLFNRERLLAIAPVALHSEVRVVNDGVERRLDTLGTALCGALDRRTRELVRVAAIEVPYGLTRPYIGREVPDWMEEVVAASARATLALLPRRASTSRRDQTGEHGSPPRRPR